MSTTNGSPEIPPSVTCPPAARRPLRGTTKSIVVRERLPGLHRYQGAPAKVGYLASVHRHEFHIEVTVDVLHGNRQVEFFMFRDELMKLLLDLWRGFPYECGLPVIECSCEDMAEMIGNRVINAGYFTSKVVVSEDGQNDGVMEYHWRA